MSTRIHPISLPFQLPINAEKSVDRLVHAYIVVGEQICVVDIGLAASAPQSIQVADRGIINLLCGCQLGLEIGPGQIVIRFIFVRFEIFPGIIQGVLG